MSSTRVQRVVDTNESDWNSSNNLSFVLAVARETLNYEHQHRLTQQYPDFLLWWQEIWRKEIVIHEDPGLLFAPHSDILFPVFWINHKIYGPVICRMIWNLIQLDSFSRWPNIGQAYFYGYWRLAAPPHSICFIELCLWLNHFIGNMCRNCRSIKLLRDIYYGTI